MFDSKKAVSRMLDEDAERLAVRRMVRQTQKEQMCIRDSFGGVFPCGQPHVGLGAVGTAIYNRGGGMMGDRIVRCV